MPIRMDQIALRTSIFYVVAAVLWILVLDWLLLSRIADRNILAIVGAGKDWLFVLITAIILYVSLHRQLLHAKQTADELHDSGERLRLALEAARADIWEFDLRTGQFLVSERARDPHGLLSETVLTQEKLLAAIHPEDRQVAAEALRATIERGIPLNIEFRAPQRDGSVLWLSAHADVKEHTHGQKLIGLMQDVSVRKQAELAVRNSEEHMRAILNTAIEAIITINSSGVIVSVNTATRQIFGYDAKELVGHNVTVLMPSPFCNEHNQYIANYLKTRRSKIIGVGREAVAKRKDGSIFPVEIAISEIDHLGLFTGFLRDISDRKKTEAEKEKIAGIAAGRERMAVLGEVAAGVAHEFRNPLHGVLNCVKILRSRVSKDESIQRWLNLQEEGLQRMDLISARLLRLGRDEMSPRILIDPAEVIRSSISFVQARAHKMGIEISSRISERLKPLSVDPERISEALLNLLTNSLDACQKGGAIEISADSDEQPGMIAITVKDSGAGIPDDVRNRVFEPFFTTKPIGKGSGLGLALVKKIVDQHGGSVTLDSQPGKGTTVRMVLPQQK